VAGVAEACGERYTLVVLFESRCRRRERKKRNSIKSSKLIGLLAKIA
jgi:hypothetical protein